jgi:ArsR family transcriptional regulator
MDVTRGAGARHSQGRSEELEALSNRLDALADANRLRILHLLHTCGEMCVCELQDALGLTAPNLSFHLQVLRFAGFVRSRKQGKWVFYRVLSGETRAVAGVLGALFEGEPPAGTSSTCVLQESREEKE